MPNDVADLTEKERRTVEGECLACIAYFAIVTGRCSKQEMIGALAEATRPTGETSETRRRNWWGYKLPNIHWAFRAAGLSGATVHGRLIPEIDSKGLKGGAGVQRRIAGHAVRYFLDAPDRCRSLAAEFLTAGASVPPVLLEALEAIGRQPHADGGFLGRGEALGVGEIDEYAPSERDTRQEALRQIKLRRGQQRFRDALRRRYGDRCAVTGCDLLDVLEAAHIRPFRGEPDHHPENGLLLRADIHTLFDLGLLSIDPTAWIVWVHPRVRPNYPTLHRKAIEVTGESLPSPVAMLAHFEAARSTASA
jgi:hypothetical protein